MTIDMVQLDAEGWTSVPALDADTVASLLRSFDSLEVGPHEFFATSNDRAGVESRRIRDELRPVLEELAELIPTPHRPIIVGFISKGAHSGATVDYHQDLTYTDEDVHRTTLLWIPLVDVDDTNGALSVVPGSHRWSGAVRPGGLTELPTTTLQHEFAERAVDRPLRAGEALAYDAALVHGSSPNRTDAARPVLTVAFVPRDAELRRFHVVDNEVREFKVDDDHFVDHSLLVAPEGPSAPAAGPFVTTEELFDAMGLGSGDAGVEASPWRDSAAVLVDEGLDRRLRRDGFVVTDLVDAEVAEGLRRTYEQLHGLDGGEGFEADLNNTDTEYRRAAAAAISATLDDVCRPLFRDFEPFLRVFLCKWPGENSDLYLHRDWMYVDERAGYRTYVVWVALQDITRENGALQVLRGTHQLDRSLRGTELNPTWLNHHDAIRPRLLEVPVRAGQAIIFDNCLVHCSLPNNTSEPRVTTATGWRPAEAPLVHFRRISEDAAARYDIDDEFFFDNTPASLMARPPDLPVADIVPYEHQEYSADAVAEFVDGSPLGRLDAFHRARHARRNRRAHA